MAPPSKSPSSTTTAASPSSHQGGGTNHHHHHHNNNNKGNHNMMGVSTAGHRRRINKQQQQPQQQHQRSAGDQLEDMLQQATSRALEDVEYQSNFLDQLCEESYSNLPRFESDEIGIGTLLGMGEFGEVLELINIKVMLDCPCDTCGVIENPLPQIPPAHHHHHHHPPPLHPSANNNDNNNNNNNNSPNRNPSNNKDSIDVQNTPHVCTAQTTNSETNEANNTPRRVSPVQIIVDASFVPVLMAKHKEEEKKKEEELQQQQQQQQQQQGPAIATTATAGTANNKNHAAAVGGGGGGGSTLANQKRHMRRHTSTVSFAGDVKLPEAEFLQESSAEGCCHQQHHPLHRDAPNATATAATTAVADSTESSSPLVVVPIIMNDHQDDDHVVDNHHDDRHSHHHTGNHPDHEHDDDNSTLSTSDDEESVTRMMEDEEDLDGDEGTYLRGYMSTHLMRQGIARYAIKRVRTDLNQETQLEAVVDLAVEAKFLAAVRHPNVVKMRGTVGIPGHLDFMIIMDRLKITLREKMAQWNAESKGKTGILGKLLMGKNNDTLLWEQYADKLLAVYDVARAMKYLHNHMIIFRDLKPENVAVDVRGDMRLFDFGLVKELKAKDLVEPPDSFKATGLTGSRRYMAPEVVSCKNYGLKADVYSFAIVFWEVFSGKEAYSKMSFDKHFDQVVVKGKRPHSKTAATTTRNLSKSMLHLMPEMWSAHPRDRPAFSNICDRIAGECVLSSNHHGNNLKQAGGGASHNRDSDRSHQSYLTDRTRYLMNRSLRSRMHSIDMVANGDSSDSAGSRIGPAGKSRMS